MNRYRAVCGLLAAVVVGLSASASAAQRPQGLKEARLQANIANGVVPTNGGDCGTPTAFTASPYADSGNNTGAPDIISTVPSACSQFLTVEGPQVVYSFVPGSGANLTFTVNPTDGNYDPAVYLVSTCADGNSCISGADDALYGDPESFSVSTLTAGTTYYLHVDSFYAVGSTYGSESGPFDLNVTGTFPVELQEFEIN